MGYEKQLSPGYFNLVLDFNSKDVLTTLEVKQYDSYWLDLHFTQGGQLFDLSSLYPSGSNPSLILRVRRPDGKVIFNEIHEDNGEYTTFLSIKNLSKVGKVYADVALYTEDDGNTYIFSTQPFILDVIASPGLQGQDSTAGGIDDPIIDGTPSLPSDFFNIFQPYVDSNNILVLTEIGATPASSSL